jgi:hypothetical protein
MGSIRKINMCVDITIDIGSPELKQVLKAFVKGVAGIFEKVLLTVVREYAASYLRDGVLARLLGCREVVWKTSRGNEMTSIMTPFGRMRLPQLQVKDKETGRRYYITRLLLGLEKFKRIPEVTQTYLGLMGALAPLRVVNKFLSLFSGVKFTLMSIVRAMRSTASKIEFGIDRNESGQFEADGTGLPIIRAGKRGKELEILVQRKKRGGIRIAGMVVSAYKQGWKKLFAPLLGALKKFKEIVLVTDGDTSPLEAVSAGSGGADRIKVIVQRCLFHIPYEMKYTLWKDKVKRKSKAWRTALAKIYEIVAVKRVRDDPGVLANLLKWKRNLLSRLIHYCERKKWRHTASYLQAAYPDMYSGIERRIAGGTSSLIERVMRTVNQRINVAQWSETSALAVAKIRGAYYYNDFDV